MDAVKEVSGRPTEVSLLLRRGGRMQLLELLCRRWEPTSGLQAMTLRPSLPPSTAFLANSRALKQASSCRHALRHLSYNTILSGIYFSLERRPRPSTGAVLRLYTGVVRNVPSSEHAQVVT